MGDNQHTKAGRGTDTWQDEDGLFCDRSAWTADDWIEYAGRELELFRFSAFRDESGVWSVCCAWGEHGSHELANNPDFNGAVLIAVQNCIYDKRSRGL